MNKFKNLKLLTATQWMLFLVSTLMWIGVKLGQFMLRTQGQGLSTDVKWIAAAVGISGLVGFAVRFPLGVFAEQIKYKMLLIRGSILISVIGALVYIFNPSIHTLYVFNLTMGLAICSYVIFNVLFAEVSKLSGVIISVAILAISNNIGSWVGPILGGYLIPYSYIDDVLHYDFSSLITAKVACGFLAAAFVLSLFIKDVFAASRFSFKQMINRRLIVISILGLIVTFMKYATLKYGFETIVRLSGGLPFHVGNIDANYDILHIIGGLLAGKWLSKKFGNNITILIGIVFMSSMLLLSYIYSSYLTLFLIFNLVAGFGMGVAYITLMAMAIERSEQRHSSMGFFQAIYMFGIYYAPKACELIISATNIQAIYLVCSILGIVSLLWVLTLKTDPE